MCGASVALYLCHSTASLALSTAAFLLGFVRTSPVLAPWPLSYACSRSAQRLHLHPCLLDGGCAVLSAEHFSLPLPLANASRAALAPAVGLATLDFTFKRSRSHGCAFQESELQRLNFMTLYKFHFT